MTPDLDCLDHSLIVATQGGLPLVPEPYAALAEQIDTSVDDVLARLRRMQESGVIRRIDGLLNTHH